VIHRHVLFNEQVRDSSEKLLAPGQAGLLAGWGVFSTIRVLDGVLFALRYSTSPCHARQRKGGAGYSSW
jgi:hypothetical protein